VKGHSGGSEAANERAKNTLMRGRWMSEPSLATPAGIRQAYPLYHRVPHMKWPREELRGLTYLHTDRGPMRAWLHQIGRAEDPYCTCGETQNAAHLMEGGCVGGKKRKWEDIWSDPEFARRWRGFYGSPGRGNEGGGSCI